MHAHSITQRPAHTSSSPDGPLTAFCANALGFERERRGNQGAAGTVGRRGIDPLSAREHEVLPELPRLIPGCQTHRRQGFVVMSLRVGVEKCRGIQTFDLSGCGSVQELPIKASVSTRIRRPTRSAGPVIALMVGV